MYKPCFAFLYNSCPSAESSCHSYTMLMGGKSFITSFLRLRIKIFLRESLSILTFVGYLSPYVQMKFSYEGNLSGSITVSIGQSSEGLFITGVPVMNITLLALSIRAARERFEPTFLV